MSTSQPRVPGGIPTGGRFAATTHPESDATLADPDRPYEHSTPPECDAVLADLWYEQQKIRENRRRVQERLDADVAEREHFDETGKYSNRYAVMSDYNRASAERSVDIFDGQINELQEKIDPIEAEFNRRGGWSRFFLVKNTNGHVHSSMRCTTCFPDTQYGWLTDYSGMDESQIVEEAGDSACSTCFPTAPVADRANPRPNRLETPEMREARETRAREKAAREAKKLATGIWNADGTELREVPADPRWSGQVIKTERTAEIKAVEYLARKIWSERVSGRNLEESDYARADRLTFERIVPALAAKRSQTEDEVRAYLQQKAIKKDARDSR